MSSKKINNMGSEVVHGHRCRPVNKDPNRPMMFYKYHIIACGGGRCQKNIDFNLSDHLRSLITEAGLNKGKERIKVTTSNCFGACRFKNVALFYENLLEGEVAINNGVWIKQVEKFSNDKWFEIFECLKSKSSLRGLVGKDHIIDLEIFE